MLGARALLLQRAKTSCSAYGTAGPAGPLEGLEVFYAAPVAKIKNSKTYQNIPFASAAQFALSLARAGFMVRSTFRLRAAGWRAVGEEGEVGVGWRFRRYFVRGVFG